MVTGPQPSEATATPVALVVVIAGQSRTRLVGAEMLGGVVSRTVMVCTALVVFPHWSVAVQVRAITLVLPQLVVTTSPKLIVTAEQPSWAVATPVAFVVVMAGHSRVRSLGAVTLGGVVSRTVMVCTALALLPH